MKEITIMMGAVLFALGSHAQTAVEDSVETGPGYANSVFYKLDGGNKTSVDNTNWDLALDVSGMGTSIRINGQAGTELWHYPNGGIADWSTVDTAGISTWVPLYDSDEVWAYGAFDAAAGSDPFDVGWGMYNVQNHQIIGDRLFIIKLSDGSYQKLLIQSMIGGVYTVQHATVDGGMDMTHTLTKADFAGKNFGYFSLQDHSTVDREPLKADWDLVAQKYVSDLGDGNYYPVTGILTNKGVYAAEARGVNVATANHGDYTSDSLINTIGYDWKEFNMDTYTYDIEADLSYFISDVEGNIWQVVFTGFEGSSTGKMVFNKTLLSSVGIKHAETNMNVAVYPNPSTNGNVSLVFHLEEDEALATVYDMTGKVVADHTFRGRGFEQRSLQLNGVPAGTYILRLTAANKSTTKKLIIQ